MSDQSEFTEWRDEQTGELLAYLGTDEDGDIVGLDPTTGEVVGYWDAETGEPLEVETEADGEEDADYDDGDEQATFEQRLQAAEEAAAQPREAVYIDHGPDFDQAAADLQVQADYAESVLGRPLLHSELRAIHREAAADVAAGRDVDIDAISERLRDMNGGEEGLLDVDTGHRGQDHQSRVEFMTQRLQDNDRAEAAAAGLDDISEPEPPGRGSYDMDDRAERQAYMVDRLRGVADVDDTFSSSSYTPDSGDGDD